MDDKKDVKKLSLFSLFFVLIYIFLEITFNIGLIDFVNSKNTEVSTFNNLETLGRILSSIGLSLFIVNIFKISQFVTKIIFILLLGIAFYFTQNYIFNKIIDDLPNETKIEAYSFGVYRNIYINHDDKIEDDSFKNMLNSKDIIYNEVVNSMIGVLLYNKDINQKVNEYVTTFFDNHLTLNSEELSVIYDKLSMINNDEKLNEFWKRYVIENKRYNNYNGFFKKEYKKKFIENIGVEPNLPKDEFIQFLKSRNESYKKIADIIIVPENKEIGMSPLYLKDIPEGLNKKDWTDYVQNHISKQVEKVLYKAENIDNLPHSRAIISSVVIVPIAIILSLVSILLNIYIIFSSMVYFVKWLYLIVITISFLSFSFINNHYGLNYFINGFMHMEKTHISLLSGYREFLHSKFINDDKPNYSDIIVIKKPEIPNFQQNYEQLNTKFEEFNNMTKEFENNNDKKSDLKIDDDKLEERGYYGEVDKANPYIKN